MRHRVRGYKLNRSTAHRKAMWRNMAISLFTHGQITTTVPKAKSLQPFVEKLITMARKGDLAARRRVIKHLGDPYMVKSEDAEGLVRNRYGEIVSGPRVVKHLFDEIGPRYADREGGYTRVVRLGKHRLGDGGDLCVIQLVGDEQGPQVSGQYSRRRDKANRRMELAAQLRKGRTADQTEEPQEQQETAVATEAPVEQPSDDQQQSEPEQTGE